MTFGPLPPGLVLPPWILRAMRGATVAHDAAVLAGAVYGFQRVPPTVAGFLTDAPWIVTLWVAILGGGALVSTAGAVAGVVRVELAGCALTASGLLVYAAAVLLGSTPSLTAGFLFLAGALAIVLRGLRLLAGAALTVGRFPEHDG